MSELHHGLKSPTCDVCARAKGLSVPGNIHTVYEDVCANCGRTGPVSTACDWYKHGEAVHPDAMD